MPTILSVLESFLLARDLAPDSIRFYRSQISVFCGWSGCADPPLSVDAVNRFLLAKQEEGKSWSYRKALRTALRALLNHAGITGKLRPVKSQPLDPTSWTFEEVQRLIVACGNDQWLATLVEAAWWTGLSKRDLDQLEFRHFSVGGVLRWRRTKTSTAVVVAIPPELLDKLPRQGKCWPRRFSNEYFRRYFRRVVKAAGLTGTFKKLRKSSGTAVEMRYPGCGHRHLGNTRRVFELHYLAAQQMEPLLPAAFDRPWQPAGG